jgi:heme exporter protein A
LDNAELILTDIEKKFVTKTIFKKVNLNLKNGSSLALTGRNGSGKSTLIKIIAGLLAATKGKCTLNINGNKTDKEHLYRYTGFVAPYLNLYDELSAYENLEFFSVMKSNGKKADKEYINSLLERVNLYNRRYDFVKDFSSGMKQRLKLAFSIINSPPLLLMDEPRTNLDTYGIDIAYGIIEEQIRQGILILATNEKEDTAMCKQSLNIEDYA